MRLQFYEVFSNLLDFGISYGKRPIETISHRNRNVYESNNNNLFYQESNTFGTVILKYFTKRTQPPKRLPKSTQTFQGEYVKHWSLFEMVVENSSHLKVA